FGLLLNGTPRQQVVQAVWRSPEHRGLQVDRFYQTFLHRAADAAGRAGFVQAFLAGAEEVEVGQFFLTSAEYAAAHTTPVAFAAGLYADVLARNGSDAEIAGWQQALQGGVSRAAAARAFLTPAEAAGRTADRLDATYPRRPADPAGRQTNLALLLGGLSSGALSELFLTSDEYFQRP